MNHKPRPKIRPRFGKRNGKHVTYDPQSSEKRALKWHFANQMRENDFKMLSGDPLSIEVLCYCSIPNSLSQAKKTALEGQLCIKKPDLDNYLKEYLDILSGIAYPDDNIICRIWCEKRYSKNPRVEIKIESLNISKEEENII